MVTAVAASYALFVIHWLSRREPVLAADVEPCRQRGGQVSLGPELAPVANDAVG